MAALNVLRIHSETVWPLAFAAASTRLRSSGLNRTGTMEPLAVPLGSFGLPGFLVFFVTVTLLRLLYDGGSHGCFRRYYRRVMQHGHVSLRVLWIVRIVRPSVYPVGLRMAG
jgi:hypothetical protein